MKRMANRTLVALLFIATVAGAADARKARPPLPKPKPEVTAHTGNTEADEVSETNSAMVLPRPKPGRLAAPPLGQREVKPLSPDNEDQEDKPAPGVDMALCRNELAELGARFTIPEMPAADGKCKVPNPVQITLIATPAGDVRFPDGPILNCVFAKRFTQWVSDIAAPVVKAHTGEALFAVGTGPGYECRGRNGDGSAKISEHAFGNAIDITKFQLADKESLPVANVAKTGNVESRWLMALRVSSCGYFTTVLGPGSNEAHAAHYHFDLGIHGKSSNYRICQ